MEDEADRLMAELIDRSSAIRAVNIKDDEDNDDHNDYDEILSESDDEEEKEGDRKVRSYSLPCVIYALNEIFFNLKGTSCWSDQYENIVILCRRVVSFRFYTKQLESS